MTQQNNKIGFLSFEFKKIILPIVLLAILMYQVSLFYIASNQIGDYECKAGKYILDLIKYKKENNSIMLNNTVNSLKPIANNSMNEVQKTLKYDIFSNIILKIDPLLPPPCEIYSYNNCKFYKSKKYFDCVNKIKEEYSKDQSNLLNEEPNFNSVSKLVLIINFIIVFIMGYIISLILIFIFRKLKIKK